MILTFINGCGRQEISTIKKPLPPPESQQIEKTPDPVTIEITAVGDFLMHMPVVYSSWNPEKKDYNFASQLTDVEKYLSAPDITIANLETRLAGKENGGYSGYPQFNCPEQLALGMKEVGIDVVTTANNHSLDRGFDGLLTTLENLESAGLKPVGNYKTEQDRRPLVMEVKKVKIGILNYTYSTNGIPIPEGKDYAIDIIDLDSMKKDINYLQNQQTDLIIAYLHFGTEYQRQPNQFQKDLVSNLFNMGVDVIFGDHPHVLQPLDMQQNNFVIYSLGNFISNQRWQYSDSGVIVNVTIKKDFTSNTCKITEVDYIPTWVHVYWEEGKKKYRVVPVEKAISDYEDEQDNTISKSDYLRLKEVWQETTLLLNNNEDNILPRAVH
ncbi:MAG: CapA family protein [Firmicutes bacterium]|nr:CapA family protein [Bacillota bacterium]